MLSRLIRRVYLTTCINNELLVCVTPKTHDRHVFSASSDKDFLHNYKRSDNDKQIGKIVTLDPEQVTAFHGRRKSVKKAVDEVEDNEEIDNEKKPLNDEGSNYVKLGSDTTLLRSLMINVKSSKMRGKSNQILLEGKRLLQDALAAGAKPVAIFCSRSSDLKTVSIPEGFPIHKVLYKNLQLWSDVSTSQGVLGIFEMPDENFFNSRSSDNVVPLTIVCDNVRDPGNMGSVLRTACAVGCSQLLITKGCVDVWEPKVLRSAAGAHFRINMIKSLTWGDIDGLIDREHMICVADYPSADSNDSRIKHVPTHQDIPLMKYHSSYLDTGLSQIALVIGGETEGVSKEAFQFAEKRTHSRRVYIPLANRIESLNVGTALGIVAYEIRKQLMGENEVKNIRNTTENSTEQFTSVGLYCE